MNQTNLTPITLTLEWFLNPDHLPMIAGIMSGEYQKAGLDVKMHAPDDHYDGFSALDDESIDLHTNEPLHLFEHYSPNLQALGCFFETDGGVLLRKSRLDKLRTGETLHICTPASEPKTNRIGFEILYRYAKQFGVLLDPAQVVFVQKDFYHIANLKADDSLDGAWLCFYNFEGIEATFEGLEFEFIDQSKSPFANFSALEFISTKSILAKKGDAIDKFLAVTRQMTALCQANPELAKRYYYEYTNTTPEPLMDAIIADTLPRLDATIRANKNRWAGVRTMLDEIGVVSLSDDEYQTLWG